LPIQILPARLANQIAAGEVVERPASVVKELIENSLDSGANLIEIEIEKGGHKRIAIRDNGCGIDQAELALALSRHATSKIACLDDLEHISSLGFRGEALASISSVARLTLTSKPAAQKQAWQAHCEGRDMQVQVNPVAHPDGTSVDVLDLFFNTPARRKFLRTEKTEFNHIDEVVRRIALSRFDVGFTLKHNAKVLRKYAPANTQQSKIKRLAAICNNDFAQHAIELNSEFQGLKLKGWVAPPESARELAEFQYFYVNGRMMRDKLINHAVRQSFEGLVSADHHPAYVLYLQIEPEQVDVNVHPAKHEVRFHQSRLVHDFIYRALSDGINQYFKQLDAENIEKSAPQSHTSATHLPAVEPKHDYIQPLQQKSAGGIQQSSPSLSHYRAPASPSAQAVQGYQRLMSTPNVSMSSNAIPGQWLRINARQILITLASLPDNDTKTTTNGAFFIVDIAKLNAEHLARLFNKHVPLSQPLLMPVSINATGEMLTRAKTLYQPLLNNSIEIGWTANRIILRKVPAGFRQVQWSSILADLLCCEGHEPSDIRTHIVNCIASQPVAFSHLQIEELWVDFCLTHQHDVEKKIASFAKMVPLTKFLAAYV
jgi:DNA mismatch repair protein MutL